MSFESRISPEQSRAARGWLGWTQQELAGRAKVSLSTVKSFENGSRDPIDNNINALRAAVEGAGVRLLFNSEGLAKGIEGEPSAKKPKGAD